MPPVIIAAGIAGAAAIGGAALASGSQKSAANSAAQTAQANTNSNNALATNIYNQNNALLSPYVNRGNAAGDAINSLLGIGGSPQPQHPTAPAYGATTGYGSAGMGQPNELLNGASGFSGGAFMNQRSVPTQDGPQGPQTYSSMQYNGTQPNALAPAGPTQTTGPATGSATDAMTNFANSAGMQFQLTQGEKAINQGYGAAGTIQSGAALKALQNYGQQTALNNYFMPYMNLLGTQQGVGASAGSAVAGVGNNLVSNVTSNNNAAASTAAQAAIANGNANANMFGTAAGAVGSFANALASSYKPKTAPPPQSYIQGSFGQI